MFKRLQRLIAYKYRPIIVGLIALLLVAVSHADDLQIEAEIDGLKFDLVQALQSQDHAKTLSIIDQLNARGAELAPEIDFFEAQVASAAGENQRAANAAKSYLSKAPNGSFANQAQSLFNTASSALGNASAAASSHGAAIQTAGQTAASGATKATAATSSGGSKAAKKALELALNLVVSASKRPGSKRLAQTAKYDETVATAEESISPPGDGYHYAGFCNQISQDGRFALLTTHTNQGFINQQQWATQASASLHLYDRATKTAQKIENLPRQLQPCSSFFWKSGLFIAFQDQGDTRFIKLNPKTGQRIRLEQVSQPRGCGVGLRHIRLEALSSNKNEYICSGNIRYRFEEEGTSDNNQTSLKEVLSDSWSKREAEFDPERTPLQGCNDEGSRCIFYSKGFYVSDWPHKLGQKLENIPSDPRHPMRLPGQLSGDGQWLLYSHHPDQTLRLRLMPKLL